MEILNPIGWCTLSEKTAKLVRIFPNLLAGPKLSSKHQIYSPHKFSENGKFEKEVSLRQYKPSSHGIRELEDLEYILAAENFEPFIKISLC